MNTTPQAFWPLARDRRLWLGLALGVLFTWLVFRGVDLRAVAVSMQSIDLRAVLVSVALTYAVMWVRAVRWRVLLSGVGRVSSGYVLQASMVGYTVNYLLPIRIGEVVRAYLVGTRTGFSRSAALATVVVERLIDVLSIVAIFVVITPFVALPGTHSELLGLVHEGAWGLAIAGLAALIVVVSMRRYAGQVAIFIERRLGRWLPALGRQAWRIPMFAEGVSVGGSTVQAAWLTLQTAIIWILTVAQIVVLAQGLSIDLPWTAGWLMLVGLAVGVSMPSAPGMVGTFHYAAMIVLLLYGVPRPQAVSFAVILHAVSVVPILLVGILLIWKEGFSLRALTTRDEVPTTVSDQSAAK